ncbi:hypothetical protein RRG08_038821 [Elysia crispata]|uniref:Uncharacterized protein n=1 Tax=Elysia crispata TaxID=231223 RepID=A0AAE1D3T3_9GAST|nr:hypothetical protein RRG08_038821 [Elysia crispata]
MAMKNEPRRFQAAAKLKLGSAVVHDLDIRLRETVRSGLDRFSLPLYTHWRQSGLTCIEPGPLNRQSNALPKRLSAVLVDACRRSAGDSNTGTQKRRNLRKWGEGEGGRRRKIIRPKTNAGPRDVVATARPDEQTLTLHYIRVRFDLLL